MMRERSGSTLRGTKICLRGTINQESLNHCTLSIHLLNQNLQITDGENTANIVSAETFHLCSPDSIPKKCKNKKRYIRLKCGKNNFRRKAKIIEFDNFIILSSNRSS